MKKFVAVAFAFGLLINVSGCSSAPGESEMKESIKLMNDLADAMEKKDAAKIKELEKKGKDLEEKIKGLKLSEADQKKLQEKYKADLEKATARIAAAGMKMMMP